MVRTQGAAKLTTCPVCCTVPATFPRSSLGRLRAAFVMRADGSVSVVWHRPAASPQPPHRPDGVHHIIEGSTPGHRVGLPHQRLQVARPADFLMLEQRPTVAR